MMFSLLKVHLQLRGYSVFIDVERLEAGKFDNNLLQSIKTAKNFILVLTPKSLDRCIGDNDCKDWVHKVIDGFERREGRRGKVIVKSGTDSLPKKRCGFAGNRGRHTGPVQHHTHHGQLLVARTGNAAGGHAERVEVQRGPVDPRLPGRVRGEGGEVHAGRAERDPGRSQFGPVAEPARDQKRNVRAQHAADHGPVAAHVPEDAVQRERTGPER